MTGAIQAISPIMSVTEVQTVVQQQMPQASEKTSAFERLLLDGIETTNAKIADANRTVAAFAVDDSVPPHRVAFALEEARLSLELMLQVRNRLVEGYQQIMNMQV